MEVACDWPRLIATTLPASQQQKIDWEECACLLCDGRNWTPLLEASDPLRSKGGLRFQIVKCAHCGLCFTNPRPDASCIRKQFYPPEYHSFHSKQGTKKSRHGKADPMRKLLPIVGKARLLDFGCGAGDFLQRMHALKWHVTGLDPEDSVVERIRGQLGLTAHAGSLPYPLWADASFEAITMWQSLEHAHDPLDVLRDAHRLLTPKGRLLVTVPNLESLSARWFGSNWYGLDVPRHLTHFTPETLRGMLQRAGFDAITMQQERRGSWIRHSARLSHERQADGPSTRWLRTPAGLGPGWMARPLGAARRRASLPSRSRGALGCLKRERRSCYPNLKRKRSCLYESLRASTNAVIRETAAARIACKARTGFGHRKSSARASGGA